jgi:hypothetical protein
MTRRKFVEGELLEVNLPTGIIDVDSHQIASGIVIEDYARRDLSAFDTGLLRKIDIKRICVRIIIELHGLNPLSGKAL